MNGGADAASAYGFTNPLREGGRQTSTVESEVRIGFESAENIRATGRIEMEKEVTDFSGKWKMKSSENFEELLKELGESCIFSIFFHYIFLLNIYSNKSVDVFLIKLHLFFSPLL